MNRRGSRVGRDVGSVVVPGTDLLLLADPSRLEKDGEGELIASVL